MLSVKDFSIPRLLVRIVMLCLAITLFMPQQIAKAEPAEIVTLEVEGAQANIPAGSQHIHIYNEAPSYQKVQLGPKPDSLPDYLPTISPYGSLVFEADGPMVITLRQSVPIEGQSNVKHVEVIFHPEGAFGLSVEGERRE
ncbi:MAG: hypothetical protein F6J86_41700 [Symploca sp. SIO1B1]|nr:hypothetical protein [Symploca sp. SIO1B1]